MKFSALSRESKSRMVTRGTANVGANDSFGPAEGLSANQPSGDRPE